MPRFTRAHFAPRHAASIDETRTNLNGVCVEKDGRTVATDGHMLVTVKAPLGDYQEFPSMPGEIFASEVEPCTLAKAGVDQVVKAIPKGKRLPEVCRSVAALEGDERFAVFAVNDLAGSQKIAVPKIDGEFPNWRQIVPSGKPKATVYLDLALLKRIIAAAEELESASPSGKPIVARLDVQRKNAPIRLTVDAEAGKLTALIMPIRTQEEGAPDLIELDSLDPEA